MSGPGGRGERWILDWTRLGSRRGDPLDGFHERGDEPRFYWESPGEDRVLVARGVAEAVEPAGNLERFSRAAEGCRDLARRTLERGSRPAGRVPLLLGGFSFSDAHRGEDPWRGFPGARWVLPRCWVVREGDEVWVGVTRAEPDVSSGSAARDAVVREVEACLTARPNERSAPPPLTPAEVAGLEEDAFEERVRQAVAAIGRGELEKVVVARALRARVPGADGTRALRALRARHDDCRLFAFGAGPRLFLGASPERLVRLEAGWLDVDALAGSAPRGNDPAEDARLARALCESKKEQEEHAIVVRALRDALARRCDPLRIPEAPRVKRLRAIQHLHTPLRGRLRDPRAFSLFDLLPDLHPSPAVAGSPRGAALAWLREHEPIHRGWYAGLVGWLDRCGEGELDVALRSALLDGDEATLFAGAGILAESDPRAEALETRLKLRAAAEALGIELR